MTEPGRALPLPIGWRAKGLRYAGIRRARAALVARRGEWLDVDGVGDLGHQFRRVVDFIATEAPRVARFLFGVKGPSRVRAWERTIVGRTVGTWRILERLEDKRGLARADTQRRYLAECVTGCGGTKVITALMLTLPPTHRQSAQRARCTRCAGIVRPMDLIGQRFGSFVVVQLSEKRYNRKRCYDCACDCGHKFTKIAACLLRGVKCPACGRKARAPHPHRARCPWCRRSYPKAKVDERGECPECRAAAEEFGRHASGKPIRSAEERKAERIARTLATRAANRAARQANAPTISVPALDPFGLGDLRASLARLDAGARGGLSS